MKFLKALLLIILILAGIWVTLCLIGPSQLNVSRSTFMETTPAAVYEEVANFNKWPAWSPWANQDTTMVTSISGSPFGKGAVMEWVSDEMGEGRQEITAAIPNKVITCMLTFSNMPGDHKAEWFFDAEGEDTKVTWTMESAEVPFLIRGLLLISGGAKPLADQYDQGLADLKRVVEAKPLFKPQFTDAPGFWYIGIEADSVTAAMLANGSMHERAYLAIQEFLQDRDLIQSGMPLTFTRRFEEGVMDLTFALPVADSVGVTDNFVIDRVPAGRVASAIHKGAYDMVDETWNKFDPYFEAYPQSFRYYPYEQYVNDPADVQDSTDYLTRIVFPVD